MVINIASYSRGHRDNNDNNNKNKTKQKKIFVCFHNLLGWTEHEVKL